MNAKTYEEIANNGEKNTVILFSAGNQDAKKALDVLALENRSLDNNINFISVGSPVDKQTLSQAASKVQANVSGQWKDPVANTMPLVASTVGFATIGLVVGSAAGAAMASGAAPVAAYGGALVGGCALLVSLKLNHSLEAYLKKNVKGVADAVKDLSVKKQDSPIKK